MRLFDLNKKNAIMKKKGMAILVIKSKAMNQGLYIHEWCS